MSTLVERLDSLGVKAKDYTLTCGKNTPESILAERIRADFQKTYGPLSPVPALRDALFTSLPSYLTAKTQGNIPLPEHTRTKDLVFIIHGLGEHSNMFRKLKIMGDLEGQQLIVPVDYDDSQEFTRYSMSVRDSIDAVASRVDHQRVYVIGHSTGADVLRYLNSQEQVRGINGLVLAAPATNGKVPDRLDTLLFGKKIAYHNPTTYYGREIVELFQKPLMIPGITLTSLHNAFIPLPHALDRTGRNIVLSGLGHVAGTGNHTKGNKIYLEVLKELSEPK